MHRFFIDKNAVEGNKAVVTGEDVVHISRVLRLKKDDEVELIDGASTVYKAKLQGVSGDEATFIISESLTSHAEPNAKITLFQGLPKSGKFELIVQKCVELGVNEIIPVDMARCVVRLKKTEFEKKRVRYQRVAYEAAKQSGRGAIPSVGGLQKLNEITFESYDLVLLAYENETGRTIKQSLLQAKEKRHPLQKIALIIGPEGGFDAAEVELLRRRNADCVSLGKRILRTETAGMAAMAMILYELEG